MNIRRLLAMIMMVLTAKAPAAILGAAIDLPQPQNPSLNKSEEQTQSVSWAINSSVSPELSWNITGSDQTVSMALARWAASAGWQLAWQAPRDLPAFQVSYLGDFESAVESLMRDSQNSEYPLHACLYDNKVVRVLHITQTCSR